MVHNNFADLTDRQPSRNVVMNTSVLHHKDTSNTSVLHHKDTSNTGNSDHFSAAVQLLSHKEYGLDLDSCNLFLFQTKNSLQDHQFKALKTHQMKVCSAVP
jgi:hypothetical protein